MCILLAFQIATSALDSKGSRNIHISKIMRGACIISLILLVSVFSFHSSASESVLDDDPVLTQMTDIHGISDTRVILQNNSHIQLFELSNNSVLDTKSCQSFYRMNALADTVMCSDGIYSIGYNNLTLIHNGPIDLHAQPKTNYTLDVNGNYQSSNSECLKISSGWIYGSIDIMNGSTIHKSIQLSLGRANNDYETISIKFAYLHEDSTSITIIFDSNSLQYYCAPASNYKIYTFDYSAISSIHFVKGGSNGGAWGTNFGSGAPYYYDAIRNGAVSISRYSSSSVSYSVVELYPNADFPTDEGNSYDLGYMRPTCSITATEVGVSGDYVTLNGVNYPIENTPSAISCNSDSNATMIVNGKLVTLWNDEDLDGYNDLNDAFRIDNSQWSDIDGDGYGDNPGGVNPDSCPSVSGASFIDTFGCLDIDGDGVSNSGDAFPRDSTQTDDTDQDGYGDNSNGTFGDVCPYTYGESTRDRYGCPDSDFDGWSDENDIFPQDSSQWGDWDGDGFGDQLNGIEGDSCPSDPGNSTKDRYGCIDSDGDGWSDDGDDLPQNPTQWRDRDGDGYGDNQEENATMSDTFPADGTQWNDTDGDGHGDNPFGTQGDWFPNDPTRWQDSDQDGIADEDDAFPNEKSQTMDTDGDGYGDDANGSNPDAFPNDAEEWSDTDGDGIGNNADAFPFDPSQQTDSDGDGFGDNERGSGADKFPSDSTQWADIDGDGYGDNAEGMNPDAFITDPTQWADTDGDGYGDNPTGRLADAFIEDSTQWIDEDEDGFGDNQSGNNPDPFLLDFDNDGYNDSIDPLPKLASPGDLDNDGVSDEEDLFPEDFREWADNDGDGVGDNADTDDDNDGWLDADEVREGTDPFSSSEQPVDSFEIVIPGTAVGLGAWDLIGIFGGVPLFIWIGFGFITRNGRTAKYEEKLRSANTRDELEGVARQWEYSLMLRMLGPHQGIRLERLRAELDDVFERQNQTLSSLEQSEYNQTQLVQKEMNQNEKQVPEINLKPDIDAVGSPDENGYEWITAEDGKNWYRAQGTKDDWVEFSS